AQPASLLGPGGTPSRGAQSYASFPKKPNVFFLLSCRHLHLSPQTSYASFPKKNQTSSSFYLAGTFTLALRLVIGWTYFSAFWRRLVLENKLNPDAPGYVGEKFNHFLPNALLIKPFIEFLVSHADLLWWFMLLFTLIEGFVGLFVMLGLFTRLMSVGVLSLAL